jgi:hypothetical protein
MTSYNHGNQESSCNPKPSPPLHSLVVVLTGTDPCCMSSSDTGASQVSMLARITDEACAVRQPVSKGAPSFL